MAEDTNTTAVAVMTLNGDDLKLLFEFFPGLLGRVEEERQASEDLVEFELGFAVSLAKMMWLNREQSFGRLAAKTSVHYEDEMLKMKRVLRHMISGMDDFQHKLAEDLKEKPSNVTKMTPKKPKTEQN